MNLKALTLELTPDLKQILSHYAKNLVHLLKAGTGAMPGPLRQHVLEALDNGEKVGFSSVVAGHGASWYGRYGSALTKQGARLCLTAGRLNKTLDDR